MATVERNPRGSRIVYEFAEGLGEAPDGFAVAGPEAHLLVDVEFETTLAAARAIAGAHDLARRRDGRYALVGEGCQLLREMRA